MEADLANPSEALRSHAACPETGSETKRIDKGIMLKALGERVVA